MRNVNPDDLDQLAKLIDGKGGLEDKLDEAFTRASNLGVTDKLGPIKPMRSWVTTTAPDLRKRATLVRGDQLFERGDRETYSDWLARIEAHYLAKVPGLKGVGEKNIEEGLKDFSEVLGMIKVGGVTTVAATAMTTVFAQNSWHSGLLRKAVNAEWWARGGSVRAWAGARLLGLPAGELRSLAAPGSWLPGQLGNLFARNRLYQQATRIPFTTTLRGTLLGRAWDGFRTLPVVRSPLVTRGVNFLVGSDALAARYGGLTHSGALVARAGQANLFKVGRTAAYFQKLNNARPGVIAAGKTASPFLKGLGAASKTGGFLRVAGIGGSALSTGVSAANVWAQGNPKEAFKKKGAGYVADVAEVGFNASLTSAMIAPNPFTIGATVVTGAVYGGAKVVEHWDDIKHGAGKAKDWVGNKARDLGKGVAKSKLNPMNW
ncbi:PE-PGRS family protein [Streptomyces sp. p1417]|uniref:PE-PGRS family protein n=1 Tax=Streptomyces typhae TaxID=2681492 RepID=A0A6L6WQM9_9ACTN|nr:PE-PGRS family protein [Streptomyces typhae]MVO83848.1 PE-PGRS family protein [Streptomyces typhae]